MGKFWTASFIAAVILFVLAFSSAMAQTGGFAITATASPGGTISPSGVVLVSPGADQTFDISPAAGFAVLGILVDSVPQGPVTSYTFHSVSTSHTIHAVFAPAHTITASASPGGTISPVGAVQVAHGGSQSFWIAPNSGYLVLNVFVDGIPVGPVSTYTFTNVTGDHAIQAVFAPFHSITASAGTGGSISPTGLVTVVEGSNQTFTISPHTGYLISDVTVDGGSVGPVASYTFTAVAANHTIQASFVPRMFTITGSAGPGGDIDPNGSETVQFGHGDLVLIIPNTGYDLDYMLVDGVSAVPTAGTGCYFYVFTSVTADHTVYASFKKIKVTIAATAEAGGSISPSGMWTIDYGDGQAFNIAPDAGYQVEDVTVNGVSHGTSASLALMDITEDTTVVAKFKRAPLTINASAGTGGSIGPSGAVSVAYGTDKSFTIAADTNYQIADVKVDGTSVGAVTSYAFSGVTANHTITATFRKIQFTITPSAYNGGRIAPNVPTLVDSGGSQTFDIFPGEGFYIEDVLVDGVSAGEVSSYTFTNVTANHTISTTFAYIEYVITVSAGDNGSISPSGAQTAHFGTDKTFTITPKPGFVVADVLVDGVSVGPVTSYTFSSITGSHTIQVTFKLDGKPYGAIVRSVITDPLLVSKLVTTWGRVTDMTATTFTINDGYSDSATINIGEATLPAGFGEGRMAVVTGKEISYGTVDAYIIQAYQVP